MKFLLGLGMGLVVGMMYAPASGKQTREKVVGSLTEWTENPEEKLRQTAGDMGSRWGRKAAEAVVEKLTGNEEKTA